MALHGSEVAGNTGSTVTTRMKRIAVYVLAALAAVFVADCLLLHPSGRWQLASANGNLYRIDTTTGNVDVAVGDGWQPFPQK